MDLKFQLPTMALQAMATGRSGGHAVPGRPAWCGGLCTAFPTQARSPTPSWSSTLSRDTSALVNSVVQGAPSWGPPEGAHLGSWAVHVGPHASTSA